MFLLHFAGCSDGKILTVPNSQARPRRSMKETERSLARDLLGNPRKIPQPSTNVIHILTRNARIFILYSYNG